MAKSFGKCPVEEGLNISVPYVAVSVCVCVDGWVTVVCTTSNLPKGLLLAKKWATNGIFVRGLRGRVQKFTFWVKKFHSFGVLDLLFSIRLI